MSAEGSDKLVYMANQIAAFFASQPGDDQAARTADHLKAFWDPSMRRAIAAHLEAGGAGLSSLARAAVRMIAQASPTTAEAVMAASGRASTGGSPADDAD